jgi:hypothetical protein
MIGFKLVETRRYNVEVTPNPKALILGVSRHATRELKTYHHTHLLTPQNCGGAFTNSIEGYSML